jgi:polar amino acid transport system substrate-binding protein
MRPATVLAVVLLAACGSAAASCTRPLVVPVAPIGVSVTVEQGRIGGVFPDLLREVATGLGCELKLWEVPRSRIEVLFRAGQADVLLAATHSDARDAAGQFVPLMQTRPGLLSLDTPVPAVRTLADVVARPALGLVAVRGFDYGPGYDVLLRTLAAAQRLRYAKDPREALRLLAAGSGSATIMPPTALYGAALGDPRTAQLAARIRSAALDDLPWTPSGVYVSAALPGPDRAALAAALSDPARRASLLAAYRRRYPAELMAMSTRPLPPP